jgi:nitrate reductase NapAB chaperone NapD
MWVSSFVVALPENEDDARAVQNAIESAPVFELGDRVGRRLPVVLEADDGSTARQWHEWVEALPGVIKVDVAFVSFDDEEEAEAGERTACGLTPMTPD